MKTGFLDGLNGPQRLQLLGASIWKTISVLGTGKTENTVKTAKGEGFKVADLLAPAAYYHRSAKFDNLQLVLRYRPDSNEFSFASLMHDADGKPIISPTNTYEIREVECIKEFAIPGATDDNGDQVVIKPGFVMLKAIAA